MTDQTFDATFYLQLKPVRYNGGRVSDVKATKITQGKPVDLLDEAVAVRLTVRVPAAVFAALQADSVIVIPDSSVISAAVSQTGDRSK